MAEPFIGEIRLLAGVTLPPGWKYCNGELLAISTHTALFSILGTVYGGDGQVNFALPNLEGIAVVGPGAGPGLTPRAQGETGGAAAVTLLTTQMPSHSHAIGASGATAETPGPAGHSLATSLGTQAYAPTDGALEALWDQALAPAGGSLPHNNRQPYLVLNYMIALVGVFPQRP